MRARSFGLLVFVGVGALAPKIHAQSAQDPAVTYLLGDQDRQGSWGQTRPETTVRDTATVITALARAAQELGLNKSTVSRRIATLESDIGVNLLRRCPRGYELTTAGHAVATCAEGMERLWDDLLTRVGDADRATAGSVRVSVPAPNAKPTSDCETSSPTSSRS